jgi:addiction module RelE/StbE family toxin
MRIRWSPEAAADLERIAAYFEERSPDTAQRLIQAIYKGIEDLQTFAQRGRPGLVPGTRELVFPALGFVVYEITEDTVDVLRIVHGRQNWPRPS